MTQSPPRGRPSITWRVPMTARRVDESHRASTPLELLFDLTFVVAVAQASAQLAHAIAQNQIGHAIPYYLMIFFAIWWAWMNFTWFASAYDTDDVLYRVLTLVQMSGVLILAASIPKAFEGEFTVTVIGYFVMRIAMVGQWLRAARSDPEHRVAALRYAGAISVVQVAWLLRLLIPHGDAMLGGITFALLALAEVGVPFYAEHSVKTTWHPHHIAERYGLFTIIVLGECVTAAMVAIQTGITEVGWSADVVVLFVAGLLLLFSLWWIYYLKPAGEGLERARQWSFWWGYGHYFLHGALAALGAGLEVSAEAVLHPLEVSDTVVAFSVAIPVALFVSLIWILHAPLEAGRAQDGGLLALTSLAVLAVAFLPVAGVPLAWTILIMAVPPIALIGIAIDTGNDGRSATPAS